MTLTKPFVATLAIVAALGLAIGPASARKHHKTTGQTQSQMTPKSKTTTGQSMGMKSPSATSGSTGATSGQASPKQAK